MNTVNTQFANAIADNIARIRELFPSCVTEIQNEDGTTQQAIDFELLKQELSASLVDGSHERYRFDWPGKRAALLDSNIPVAATLRPHREDSAGFDCTKNLFIEGDNLDALKLLQNAYSSSIDLIYIDPPYNTGGDFIYRDDFRISTRQYLLASGQIDMEGNPVTANPETDGRFHSGWLSMMYARLRVARRLLSKQGVVFISIDDGEQENLKKICDEVFGSENFINTISVNMKNIAGASGGGEDKRLKKNVEYLHVYVRSRMDFLGFNNAYDFIPVHELVRQYREEGKSWKYGSVLVEPGEKIELGRTADGSGNDIVIYERCNPVISTVARLRKKEGLSEEDVYRKYANAIFQTVMPQSSIRKRVLEYVRNNGGVRSDLYSIEYTPRSGKNRGKVYEQFYRGGNFRLFAWLGDVAEERDGVLCKKEMQGTYWNYAGETKNLTREGNIAFRNGKKPLAMIRRIIEMQPGKDITVLDFFAGSSTTAHAVLAANAGDGGTRRFIMVQLPEKGEAEAHGFRNIAELSRERIRRAAQPLLADPHHPDWNCDVGFRAFAVDTPNRSGTLLSPERTHEDLLFQGILDCGMDLSLPIHTEMLCGKIVYFVDGTSLAACFDAGVDEALAAVLAGSKPVRVVFRDDGFASDSVKRNVLKIFAKKAPGTELKTL